MTYIRATRLPLAKESRRKGDTDKKYSANISNILRLDFADGVRVGVCACEIHFALREAKRKKKREEKGVEEKKKITTTSNRRRRRDRSWKVLHEINVGKITAITGGPVRARRSRTESR